MNCGRKRDEEDRRLRVQDLDCVMLSRKARGGPISAGSRQRTPRRPRGARNRAKPSHIR